jgi:LPS-assembly protein
VRETLWYLDEKEFGPEDDKNFYHRDLFDTRLDLFSEVFRVFRVERNTLDSIRHAVRPQIIYEFIPNVDQDDLPDFDSIDRIEKKNLVTYSLTNTFTSKTRKTGTFELSRRIDQTQAAVIDAPTDYGYNDFLRFKLEQSYNINVSTRKDPDQPLSPIFTELELFPGKYLALDADALWSVYDGKFLSYNIATTLWDNRGDRLSVAYRRTKDSDEIDLNPVKSIYTGLQLKVTDSLALNASYEYNFLANTLVETGIGILYKAQCWSFDGRVNKTPDNLNFEFKINLFGLGEFGI